MNTLFYLLTIIGGLCTVGAALLKFKMDAVKAEEKRNNDIASASAHKAEIAKVREEERRIADQRQQELRLRLDEIRGKQGDDVAFQNLSKAQKAIIAQLVGTTVGNAARNLESNFDEYVKIKEAAAKSDLDLLAIERVRLLPVYELVMQSIKAWAETLKSEAVVSKSIADTEPAHLRVSSNTDLVRIQFSSGAALRLDFESAAIEDGAVQNAFGFRLRYQSAEVGDFKDVWSLSVGPEAYTIGVAQSVGMNNFHAKGTNPIADTAFLEHVQRSLNLVMTKIIVDATSPKAKAPMR